MRNFQSDGRFGKSDFKRSGGSGGGRSSGGYGGRDERPQMHTTTCSDCGKSCEVPFKPSGMKPIYCRDCFKREDAGAPRGGSDRGGRGDFGGSSGGGRDFARPSRDFGGNGDREMFSATCAECGDRCEVPFRPNGEKPVYCSNCFKKESSPRQERRSPRDFESRDFTGFGGNIPEEKVMFSTVCAECGDDCEVPFKPTGEKPVYCRNCFKKDDKSGGKSSDQYKKEFEALNQKVDSILRRLDVLMGQKSAPKDDLPTSAPEKKKAVKAEASAPVEVEVKREVKKSAKSEVKKTPKVEAKKSVKTVEKKAAKKIPKKK